MTPSPFENCILQAFGASLVFLVHVIILDLAERPVIPVHDRLERVRFIVEGESRELDAAVGDRMVQEVHDTQLEHIVPALLPEAVDQIIIDMIGLQLHELLVQVFIHVFPALDHPGGKLGGQADFFPVSAEKCLAGDDLALAVMVWVSGIDVIYTIIDRIPDHPDRFCLIHVAILLGREAACSQIPGQKAFYPNFSLSCITFLNLNLNIHYVTA